MNAQRRKDIEKIRSTIVELAEQLSIIANDERDSGENLPESFAEKKEAIEQTAATLDDAEQALQELADNLGNIE
jgi:hypothetical protein